MGFSEFIGERMERQHILDIRSDNIYYVNQKRRYADARSRATVSITMKPILLVLSLLVSIPVFAGQATPAKATAPTKAVRVYFANLKNKQTIPTKFKIQFGLEGMKVHPAGEIIEGTGHHHLIIDGSAVPAGQVVPADAQHIHFGKGQTETEIELKPGKHKLTLQFADGAHLSYGPTYSDTVDVIVK